MLARTVATVVFIGGVAIGAAIMWQKKTTLEGDVIAADLLERFGPKGVTHVECDDAPIGVDGVTVVCRVAANDGSRATFEYVIDREGVPRMNQLGGITQDEPRARPPDTDGDPWTP